VFVPLHKFARPSHCYYQLCVIKKLRVWSGLGWHKCRTRFLTKYVLRFTNRKMRTDRGVNPNILCFYAQCLNNDWEGKMWYEHFPKAIMFRMLLAQLFHSFRKEEWVRGCQIQNPCHSCNDFAQSGQKCWKRRKGWRLGRTPSFYPPRSKSNVDRQRLPHPPTQ
jgi:hypothetical protein